MNENENVDEVVIPEEVIPDLTQEEALLFALVKWAQRLNIGLFIFEKEELKLYHNIDETKDFAIAVLAKDRDNAIFNLKNQRRCYIINNTPVKDIDTI